ncbi:diaminobutyrate acetyltransferase [Alcaligenaceae bacterium]|nr:diaminobutyrate acetyltransferase [Alcaligenaceae bacterium]
MRQPRKDDAAGIHRLIAQCPPLDLNSVYTYLLLSEYFGGTCVLTGKDDTLLGFVSGYIPPERPDTLFVWQVAVHEQARGQSLGRRMLLSLLQRPALAHIQFLETTVGPDNSASRAMFGGLARKLLAPVNEQPLFERHMFGAHAHEDEPLLRIGPFTSTSLR